MNLSPLDNWRAGLPRRDLVLLPFLSLLTILALLLGAEIGARGLYPVQSLDSCQYTDNFGAVRFRPNCESFHEMVDTGRVINNYNDCGYRSINSCAVTPGQLRVAVVGTSTSRGVFVPYSKTFAALASERLKALCGRPVDFQNLATEGDDFENVPRQALEALALKPDALVMTVSDFEFSHISLGKSDLENQAPISVSLKERSLDLLHSSRFLQVMRYYRYMDISLSIDNFINYSDASEFARTPLSRVWLDRIDAGEKVLDRVAETARSQGIPFIMVFVPRREVTALAMPTFARPELDPFQLSRLLADNVSRLGVTYTDVTADFAATGSPNKLFLISSSHPGAGGHSLIARSIEESLLRLPVFSSCRNTQATQADISESSNQ